jgi:hypothetical protein
MSKKAMNLALEALTATMSTHGFREHIEEAQDKAIKALEEALASEQEHDCTRSHPHEEMSKECELRTEIARLTNQLANTKQEQGEPVAWLWKHINRKGEELNAGLSFEKVEPTNNTFWMNPNDPRLTATEVQPLYTTPQQRKPLTFERVYKLWLARFDTNEYDDVFMNFARAIEAAHGIKENT